MSINLNNLYPYTQKDSIHDVVLNNELRSKLTMRPKREYVFTEGRTISLIAFTLYGDHDYWIFLADYNDLVDPFTPSEKLYYIPKAELRDILQTVGLG